MGKRIKRGLLISAILLFCFNYGFVVANARSLVEFNEHVEVVNEQITYSVDVSENSNISGILVEITYDKDELALKSAMAGSALDGTINTLNTKTLGKIILTAITTEQIDEGGTVFKIEFSGEDIDSLKVDIKECIDKECNPINYILTGDNGEVILPKENEEAVDNEAERDSSKTNFNGEVSSSEDKIVKSDKKEIASDDLDYKSKNNLTDNVQDNKKVELQEKTDDSRYKSVILLTAFVSTLYITIALLRGKNVNEKM